MWILPLDRYLTESRAAARGRVNDRRVDHVGRTEVEEPLMEKFDPDRRMGFKNLISLPRRTVINKHSKTPRWKVCQLL